MTGRLDHVGLMVADMDAALAWYRDVLGCSVTDAWANDETGMRWAHLSYGDVPIELVFRPGLEPRAPAAAGYHHIAVEVDDCVATVAELEARGVAVVFPRSYFDRHDMDWAFIADPSGNVLEILSYRSAAR
jgi:catechol 2,3-dioxygenase-like lactoylglutathione lyase family enzyme